ncbi:hypothetical protein [Brucella sp. 10RB9210]|uniref:phage nozzle protein n=1 Tax=Brucella sp. 10RB9210 TaxID=1844037 RepID=UPI0012AE04E6|nr:hypothetical protein [Brucella sp. 10RB9210]MRN79457.1 hypothetical protein [Brucella sp. 10RB9210]
MGKISGSIANFANGVSQQAEALRLATQGEIQINAYSTVIDGLKKRPPTIRVASLGTDFTGKVHTHGINRDTNERYSVFTSPTGIRVYDLDGNEKTVRTEVGWDYLSYNDTSLSVPPYKLLTVGDYTFVSNTTKKVQLSTIVEPVSPSEALVYVMSGNYGKDYRILIDGKLVAQYSTPDGTSGAQAPGVDTSYIARRLTSGETKDLGRTVNDDIAWEYKKTDTYLHANLTGFTIKALKGTIYIRKEDGTPFSLAVEDGYNGHAMRAIQREVQDFADLPLYAEHGMAIKVTGSVSTKYDDYYVRFHSNSDTGEASTTGIWKEIPAPGTALGFEASTMPHVLVREADGTFTFKQAKWDNRKAGDEEITPAPSFVGGTVNDLAFFKNRLGLVSGENVVLSRSGSYFDFWRMTATALMDDDPIDVASAETNVSVLRHAVPFADRLVLFADQVQAHLMGNELLTPKTASMRITTAYQASPRVRPVASGDMLFFAVDRGQFSAIREYRVDASTGDATAEDNTAHVPQYIPGTVEKMAASTHEDILIVRTDKEPGSLFVYKYYWANDEKLQSSWSKWTFPGVSRVHDFWFVNSRLYLLVQRKNETFIETMDVQPGGTDDDMRFVVNLDHRYLQKGYERRTYDPYSDTTTVPTDHDYSPLDFICVTAGSDASPLSPGLRLQLREKGQGYVKINGDVRSVPIYIGLEYEMRYRLSRVFIRRAGQNGGMITITEGRLQLLQLLFQYSKSAYFRVDVTPMAQPTRTYFTNGRLMGDPENVTDTVTLSDGTFTVPVLSKNDRVSIDIVSDSYLPCSILSAEWTAHYVQKSQRI